MFEVIKESPGVVFVSLKRKWVNSLGFWRLLRKALRLFMSFEKDKSVNSLLKRFWRLLREALGLSMSL